MIHTRPARARAIVRRLLLALACFGLIGGAIAACKQAEGERCQRTSDCEDGLVCNRATQLCASPNSSGDIDATVPDIIDAAPELDAVVDAPPDTAVTQ